MDQKAIVKVTIRFRRIETKRNGRTDDNDHKVWLEILWYKPRK